MDKDIKKNARLLAEVAGWAYVASGLALAVVSLSPTALQLVNALAVPEASSPDRIARVYAGVGGGLTAGFGAAMVGVARAQTLAMAARGMTLGLVSWFVVDTGASLAHGSWQNAIGNVLFFMLGLPPMWALAATERPGHMADAKRTV